MIRLEPDVAELPAEVKESQDAGPVQRPVAPRSVRICFGRRWVSPELVGQLQAGSIVELDGGADAPADIYVDGRFAGSGSPRVVEGRLCVRVERKA